MGAAEGTDHTAHWGWWWDQRSDRVNHYSVSGVHKSELHEVWWILQIQASAPCILRPQLALQLISCRPSHCICQNMIKTQTILNCKASKCSFSHVDPVLESSFLKTLCQAKRSRATWHSQTVLSCFCFFLLSCFPVNWVEFKGQFTQTLSCLWGADLLLWDASSPLYLDGCALDFNITCILWVPSIKL